MNDRRDPKPPTLTDVAKLAGVSIPTASRVLNGGVRGPASGGEGLRRRVVEAAEQLGYSVNLAAQATKGGRARTIALVVSDIDDFGSATMIAGVMQAAETRGISVAVRTTRDDAQREAELLLELRGERHRGIIFATSRTTDVERERLMDASLRTLQDHGARIVLIGHSDLPFPSVVVDNAAAARSLAIGLVDAGHRRFAIAAGPGDQVTSRHRVFGFLDGLAERGIQVPEANIVNSEFSRDGGYEAVDQLGERYRELDLIAAMSDAMAVGVIARLQELGLAVPGDLEVSGFDQVPMLSDVLPAFSTVEVPLEAFGEAAMSLIFDDSAEPNIRRSLKATAVVQGQRLPTA